MNYYLYLIFIPIIIIVLYIFIKLIYVKFFAKNKSENLHGVVDVEDEMEVVKKTISDGIEKVKHDGTEMINDAEVKVKNGFGEVKEIFWKYFDIVFDFIKKSLIKLWHFILHFIVLFLGWLSDLLIDFMQKVEILFYILLRKKKVQLQLFGNI
jgi:hypothetical protein